MEGTSFHMIYIVLNLVLHNLTPGKSMPQSEVFVKFGLMIILITRRGYVVLSQLNHIIQFVSYFDIRVYT